MKLKTLEADHAKLLVHQIEDLAKRLNALEDARKKQIEINTQLLAPISVKVPVKEEKPKSLFNLWR